MSKFFTEKEAYESPKSENFDQLFWDNCGKAYEGKETQEGEVFCIGGGEKKKKKKYPIRRRILKQFNPLRKMMSSSSLQSNCLFRGFMERPPSLSQVRFWLCGDLEKGEMRRGGKGKEKRWGRGGGEGTFQSCASELKTS